MSAHEYDRVEKVPEIIYRVFVPIFIIGVIIAIFRFFVGLGFTGMNDGFPWGIWIVYDVLVGTAIGTGGFTMAILIYLFNKWEYHPLIRSAIITSAFGYTLAGVSVIIDLGRWWNFYSLLLPWRWNPHSVLLEVALCIMGYTLVLWIELFPTIYERKDHIPILKNLGGLMDWLNKHIKKGYAFIVALGILLPIMHQSSLGTMMVIASSKVHPLWWTKWLPVLFLLSVFMMGYSMVVIESLLSSYMLNRPYETSMIKKLAPIAANIGIFWLLIRFIELLMNGQILYIFGQGIFSFFFVLEITLISVGIYIIKRRHLTPRNLFIASVLFVFHGALYRFNVYLIGFVPPNKLPFVYMPTFGELFITFGIVSLEILLYVLFIKNLRILPAVKKS